MANNIATQIQALAKNYNLDELINVAKSFSKGNISMNGLAGLISSIKAATQSKGLLSGLLGNAALNKFVGSGVLQKFNFAEVLNLLKGNQGGNGVAKLIEFVQKLQNIK